MTRYKWLSFLSLFIVSSASAQSADSVMTRIRDYYNASEYSKLYAMLSGEFKASVKEKELTALYKSEMKLGFGNMKGYQLVETRKSASRYDVSFEHGQMTLFMVLNKASEIAGMQWQPVAPAQQPLRDPKNIASNNAKHSPLDKLVDSLALNHLVKSENCGLVIGILHKGNTMQYYYGQTEKEKGALPDENTLYEIGSLTKTFTGLLLAKAMEEGRLKADDDIRQYLPGSYPNLEYNGQPIRVIQLSNHTSGLPGLPDNLDAQPGFDINDPYKNYSTNMLMEYLHTAKPDTLPGTQLNYSNLGVAVLGLVLETVYKKDYEALVATEILKPLGMSRTVFRASPSQAGFAQGYDDGGKPASHWELNCMSPAGGIKSTLHDILLYAGAYADHTLKGMTLAQQLTFGDGRDNVAINWFRLPSKGGRQIVWHNGGTGGFTSFCGLLSGTHTAVVVLNNSAVRIDDIAITLLHFLENEAE